MIHQNDISTQPSIVRGRDNDYKIEGRFHGQNPVFCAHTPDRTLYIIKQYVREVGYLRERHALKTMQRAGGHLNLLLPIEFVDGRDTFIVFPFISGKTLIEYAERCRPQLDERKFARILPPICDAMHAMHKQGLVHRDIKAENILLGIVRASGSGVEQKVTPYVADFDVTYHQRLAHLETENIICGTPAYIAPEAWQKSEPSPCNDIYSFGITLYHVMTGKRPYRGGLGDLIQKHLREPVPDPHQENKDLSDGMRTIIMTCLQKDPGKRYQSAAELKMSIEQLL